MKKVALAAEDVRISLCTSDEEKYKNICFFKSNRRAGKNPLVPLKNSIRRMVKERPAVHPSCKIGFNCVILPENRDDLLSMIQLADELGIDFIDFKPDYFSTHDAETISAMTTAIDEAKSRVADFSRSGLYVNFTESLSRDDLYWRPWRGTCDAMRQSDFKLFISPYGSCSPVHYGAFPNSTGAFQAPLFRYSIGTIRQEQGLLAILSDPLRIPKIELKKLNPFELMLGLEIIRFRRYLPMVPPGML